LSENTVLIIEPDENLATLPFNALMDEKGRYLNATYDVVVAPGSSERSYDISERSINNRDSILLTVAGTPSGSGVAPDSLAESEVLDIAALFQHPTIFTHRLNAKAEFQTLLSRASIFHYAGHSGTTSKGGQLLIESDDTVETDNKMSFSSNDVDSRLLRHCRLVVLSACETDQGLNGHWLDRENLALTFVNAGVPEVIAARWKVDSKATGSIMRKFYASLLAGATPAQALRMALEETRQSKDLSHPYYWAGFSILVVRLRIQS
jgi:CHAT domain-containing protein